ncbi:MAG: hypothetical protein JG777_363, partial [Clostridia bacterium]|nr:hypothetical protein [Clostridia bacterium]
FNPRTRAGCDEILSIFHTSKCVFQSTHPCGVRRSISNRVCKSGRFQSTHPCGVRQIPLSKVLDAIGFQSTHPCGVRLIPQASSTVRVTVSIHAPVRGATITATFPSGTIVCFNPRTRAGCDSGTSMLPLKIMVFQSTHPCGVRQHTTAAFHQR